MLHKLEISFSSCEFFQVKINNVWMKLSWIFSISFISIAVLSKLWWIFIKKHPKVLHEYCITSNFRFFYDHFEIANYWVRRNHILYYFLYETFQTAKKKLTQIKNLTHFTHFCKFCDTRKKTDIWYLRTDYNNLRCLPTIFFKSLKFCRAVS